MTLMPRTMAPGGVVNHTAMKPRTGGGSDIVNIMCDYIRNNHRDLLPKHTLGRTPKKAYLSLYQQLMLPVVEITKLPESTAGEGTFCEDVPIESEHRTRKPSQSLSHSTLSNGVHSDCIYAQSNNLPIKTADSRRARQKTPKTSGRHLMPFTSNRKVLPREHPALKENRGRRKQKLERHKARPIIYKFLKHHRYLQLKLLAAYKVKKSRVRYSRVTTKYNNTLKTYRSQTAPSQNGSQTLSALESDGLQTGLLFPGDSDSTGLVGAGLSIVRHNDVCESNCTEAGYCSKRARNLLKQNTQRHLQYRDNHRMKASELEATESIAQHCTKSEQSERLSESCDSSAPEITKDTFTSRFSASISQFCDESSDVVRNASDLCSKGTSMPQTQTVCSQKQEECLTPSDGTCNERDIVLDVINKLIDKIEIGSCSMPSKDTDIALLGEPASDSPCHERSTEFVRRTSHPTETSHSLSTCSGGLPLSVSSHRSSESFINNDKNQASHGIHQLLGGDDEPRDSREMAVMMNETIHDICMDNDLPREKINPAESTSVNGSVTSGRSECVTCACEESRVDDPSPFYRINDCCKTEPETTRPSTCFQRTPSKAKSVSPHREKDLGVQNNLTVPAYSNNRLEANSNSKSVSPSNVDECYSDTVTKTVTTPESEPELKNERDCKQPTTHDELPPTETPSNARGASLDERTPVEPASNEESCEGDASQFQSKTDVLPPRRRNQKRSRSTARHSSALRKRSSNKKRGQSNRRRLAKHALDDVSLHSVRGPRNDDEQLDDIPSNELKIDLSHKEETEEADYQPAANVHSAKGKRNVKRRKRKFKFTQKKTRTKVVLPEEADVQLKVHSSKRAKSKFSGGAASDSHNSEQRNAKKVKVGKSVPNRRKLYPRRESVFYASDIQSVKEQELPKKRPYRKTRENKDKSLTTPEADNIPNDGIVDSADRLSIEFSNHNWFFEKYKTALQDDEDDGSAASFKSNSAEKRKANDANLKSANCCGKRRRREPSRSVKSADQVKSKRENEIPLNHEQNPENKEATNSDSDSAVNSVVKEANDAKSEIQIVEVVSLAKYMEDETSLFKSNNDNFSEKNVGLQNERLVQMAATGESDPENDSQPKSTDSNDKPLDLSKKSLSESPLDLSLSKDSCRPSSEKERPSRAESGPSGPSYACFNIPAPRSERTATTAQEMAMPRPRVMAPPSYSREAPKVQPFLSRVTSEQSCPASAANNVALRAGVLSSGRNDYSQFEIPSNGEATKGDTDSAAATDRKIRETPKGVQSGNRAAMHSVPNGIVAKTSFANNLTLSHDSAQKRYDSFPPGEVLRQNVPSSLSTTQAFPSRTMQPPTALQTKAQQHMEPANSYAAAAGQMQFNNVQPQMLLPQQASQHSSLHQPSMPIERRGLISNGQNKHDGRMDSLSMTSHSSHRSAAVAACLLYPYRGAGVPGPTPRVLAPCAPAIAYPRSNLQPSINKVSTTPYHSQFQPSTHASLRPIDGLSSLRPEPRNPPYLPNPSMGAQTGALQHPAPSGGFSFQPTFTSESSTGITRNNREKPLALPAIIKKCEVCSNKAIFLCSGCKRVAYCSRRCQFAAWKNHRSGCRF